MDWTIISIVVTAIATAIIAYNSWVNNKLTREIHELSIQTSELSKHFQKQANKAFWGIAFSTIIAGDASGRKSRLGFLIESFGWETIKESLELTTSKLQSAINSNCNDVVDRLPKD